jgi:trimethylamine--corrinoid protein Co-methyltransferase
MIPKFSVLTSDEVEKIHSESMRILSEVGVDFLYKPALDLLREYGQRVEGNRVYFTPDFVMEKVKKAPAEFSLRARNPQRTITCNHRNVNFTPAFGVPYIYGADGSRRFSTMADYDKIVRLAGASDYINHTGGNVCEPMDVPDDIRHLKMLYSHIVNSDKAFMGSAYGVGCAEDSIRLAEIVFGGRESLKKEPALISLINSISPLTYDDRMLGALMTYAEAGQACLISALVMSGSTGPVTMSGTLALQNAEVLAGITLAQCVNPGAPCIYGSTSSPADMSTVSLSTGTAETALYTAASAQMARFYGVPARGGGGLNDSKLVDAQVGYEAMLTLMSAAISGCTFVLHSAGVMQYYTAFSYEKFVVDEEICGLVTKFLRGFDMSEACLSFDDIKEVGPGGNFLLQDSTFELFRQELRNPLISDRGTFEKWTASGSMDTVARAQQRYKKVLESYEAPPLDQLLERELSKFIDSRSREIFNHKSKK